MKTQLQNEALAEMALNMSDFLKARPIRLILLALNVGLSLMWMDWRFSLVCLAAGLFMEFTITPAANLLARAITAGHLKIAHYLSHLLCFVGAGLNAIIPASGFLSQNPVGIHLAEIMFAIMAMISFVHFSNDRERLVASISPVCAAILVLPLVKFGFSLEALLFILINGFLIAAAGATAIDRNRMIASISLSARQREEAQLASAAKSQFIATMSHELRTPLNAIIGYSEIMLDGAEDGGREQDVSDHRRVLAASAHLLGLINQILDLAKLEAGDSKVRARPFNAEHMIEEAVAGFREVAEENGSTISVALDPNLGHGENDDEKLNHCLKNLISNAAKFTKNGQIHVHAVREPRNGSDWLIFTIKDSGFGIADAQLKQLFVPFLQVDPSYTRSFGGAGIGLAISSNYAKLLGGDLTLESEPGQGTTATLRIPAIFNTIAKSQTAGVRTEGLLKVAA